jgi:hypothetical protein
MELVEYEIYSIWSLSLVSVTELKLLETPKVIEVFLSFIINFFNNTEVYANEIFLQWGP